MSQGPLLHLICGLPGAGKTTLANKIAQETGAIRFCPDDWIKNIWKEKAETDGNSYRENVEQLQWELAKNLLGNNIDVIIEWGTWGQSEREKLRDEARAIGAKVKFYYLDVPREVLRVRMLERNKIKDSNEFYIPENEIETFLNNCCISMQKPTSDELKTYDYLG